MIREYKSWSGYFYVHGKKLPMQTKVTDSVTNLLVMTAWTNQTEEFELERAPAKF